MPANVRPGGSAASQKPPHAVPTRAMSLDSLHEKKSTVNLDQKIQEYLPTRVSRAVPKINHAAMQFVKTGPAGLYKSAAEQLKKAEEVKELRKTMVNEETEWQENLDKWKSSRRKRLQTTVDSIIQIKKNEEEEELSRMRKKSKTFSQIQEDKTKRGRKYNLTVHNDDDNDLSSLGLSPSKSNGSIADTQEDQDAKDLDQDNKDAKSDAGFCTGSDTGSDGVFAEDNISDTSSALGDKKEAHDSLLDTGGSKDEEPHLNGHSSSLISESFTSTTTTISSSHTAEYTYDKAIAGYKQYAENSAKKRTSSITSLNSNASQKEEDKKEKLRVNGRSPSPSKGSKLEEKVSFFSKEMEKENRVSPEPKVVLREKSPKVNISQRRSMFENVDLSTVQTDRQQKQMNRRSLDIKSKVASFENLESEPPARVRSTTPSRETNLRSKVSSFENLTVETNKVRGITPPRDANFHVKLATFTSPDSDSVAIKKRTPERDANFHKKLASFTAFETEETSREQKIVPQRDPSLKKKIASYEQLEQAAEPRSLNSREESMKSKDRSVSLENLDEPPVNVKMRPARSMMNITRRTPSTPYMEVELESSRSEKECVVEAQPVVSCKQDSTNVQGPTKRTTVYEIFEKCQVSRDVESAPLYSIFQYLSPEVNAQVFEIASKLEETPLLGSPINKAPSSTLDPPTALEEDSLELAKEYSDADINEVINDYEQVGEMLEDSSDHPENIYENITDEPTYENIYEKVDDGNLESHEPVEEHQYQTLEEVRKEVVPPPPPPARIPPPKPMEPPEVLDVTWTDGPSQAAPPSEPPPPPPPDDDSDSDASEQPQSLPAQEEDGFKRENSTRRLKKELWRRRSDFLGTSSQYIEEQAVKPPPDLSDLLRQEREAERSLIGSKVVKTTTQETLSELEIARREREIIENLERSEQMRQQQELEQQQSWGSQREEVGAGETDDHLQYQECLRSDTTSSPPGSQGFIPLPPPSPVSDATQPFAYLAANMPTPSDFIPMSTHLIGDKTSVSASPSLLSTAPEARSPLSLTPVPECDELSKCSSPMTAPEVVAHPSNKQNITPLCGLPACVTNSKTLLSPPVQRDASSNSGRAVTHPSDSSHQFGSPVITQSDSAKISDNTGCTGSHLDVIDTTTVNFNRIARPWNKGGGKSTPGIISAKAPREGKKVRFNIAPYEDRENVYKELMSFVPDSDPNNVDIERTPKKDGVTAKTPDIFKNFLQISKLHDSSSSITPSPLSSSQVMNPLTASQLETGPKVAKVVPVTSTNNPENSYSVTETSDVEHDGVDWAHATLKSTSSIEERHTEVLDKRIANVPSVTQFRIATQTSEVNERRLVTDHLVASSSTLDYSTSSVASGSQSDEYKKLAELEEEMMRHDKDMLRRAGHLPDTPPSSASSQLADPYENQIGSIIPPPVDSYKVQRRQPPSHLPLQEFYTAPTYESTPPLEEDLAPSMEDKGVGLPAGSPSQYTTLASPHPFSRSSSHSSIETNKHVPLQAARSTPLASPRESIPEPLPRKNKVVTPPVPSKTQRMLPDLNTAERLEAMRVSRMTSSESLMSSGDPMEPQGGSSALSGQQMSKQTLLALSAIPKPRLTDNESWIKKKEGQKRDYSKHWLHQEAEQRRLEQQDRISRPKQTPPLPQRRSPQSASPQFPPHQHPSSHTASYQPTQNTSPMFSPQSPNPTYSSYPQALRNPSPSRNASSIANNINNNTSNNTSSNNSSSAPISPLTTSTSTTTNNNSNSWRNQATTYQPHVPAPAPAANGDKALPESIINNLTQRINNKNTKTTYNSSSGRAGSNFTNSNYRDENYHDYMNADALSSPSGPSPLFQAGQPSPPSTQQAETNTQQDQRLLSVSGKKKCSHCSEELGRGAAMIIESLRLFYHIPCFKCCVCGIQLGNGSAGADVRVRNHKLHCHNCYSNDEGMKFSKV